jgi:hypothetical protein
VTVERVPVLPYELFHDVDGLEAGSRDDLEVDLGG